MKVKSVHIYRIPPYLSKKQSFELFYKKKNNTKNK